MVTLLYRRAEGREFHLPLADGTLAALAGAWCGFLLIVRMFDAPSIEIGARSEQYDPHWGIALAFGFAVMLFAAGVRGRQRFHGGTTEAIAADQDATPTVPISPELAVQQQRDQEARAEEDRDSRRRSPGREPIRWPKAPIAKPIASSTISRCCSACVLAAASRSIRAGTGRKV